MPLIIVPTPVGNLSDMTIRGLEELKKADFIACEDTRHTGILLKKYGISAKLLSYHEHNEKSRSDEIMSYLVQGMTVALVSDAGTPGVSDPGYEVIKRAIDEGHDLDVLPGATAVIPALLLSGLSPQPFTFFGFLPDKKGEREQVLEDLKSVPWTIAFYVSPHKVLRHLASMLEKLGDRRASLVREISKIHQQVLRGTLSTLLEAVDEGLKGEMVLVVEGGAPSETVERWEEQAQKLLDAGLSHRDIVSALNTLGVPKNTSKKWLLELKQNSAEQQEV
ncbi:MAG: 16S rRNA (cytidine(1402)-2'-O)-methyltransferase [Synergistales bacterium]|nr:16S rRNA (cytidine(1402)-2'-O)-methyltransferase [Synergistales bacterium]